MSAEQPKGNRLHLPDLRIRNFRGFKEFSVSRLGRVTLIGGENGAGKTTLLDAARVYASRGSYAVLHNLLMDNEELSEYVDEKKQIITGPELSSLFYGRNAYSGKRISIGSSREDDTLSIEDGWELSEQQGETFGADDTIALRVTYKQTSNDIRLGQKIGHGVRYYAKSRKPVVGSKSQNKEIQYQSIGPGMLDNTEISEFWESVALSIDEPSVVAALNLALRGRVERVAVVGAGTRGYGSRAMAKIKGDDWPVPLKSLGDGAVRMFGIALALANSKNGFLLMDEAENGIHHTVQRDFWKMILKAAHANNIQVLATTHSWDCVCGFAEATAYDEGLDGVFLRINRRGDRTRAVEYSTDSLIVAAEQGIEVR